jgi:hypothetical protein
VKGDDGLAIALPYALAAASLGKEASPGDQVASIRPDAVGGSDADGRTFPEEPIELGVIAAVVAEDKRRAIDEFRTVSGINSNWGEVAAYAARPNREADDRHIGEVELWHDGTLTVRASKQG